MRVNVYTPGEVRLWVRFYDDGMDLDVEECAEEEVGERPEWLEDELGQSGLGSLLQLPFRGDAYPGTVFGHVVTALRLGVAPFQPMLWAVTAPRWYRSSTPDGTEWDAEWEVELVHVAPWKAATVAQRWARFTKSQAAAVAERDRQRAEDLARRWRDTDAWFVRVFTFFDEAPYYDEMMPPDGFGLRLMSRHQGFGGGWAIAEGRAARGCKDQVTSAFDALLVEVRKERPDITLEKLRALRRENGW